MSAEKIKNFALVGAVLLIALLSLKVLMQKPVYMPAPAAATDEKGRKAGLTPYHDHQVKNTIMKNRGDVIGCYNKFIEGKPAVTDGPMKIDFEIDSDGAVTRSDKISGIGDAAMTGCVTQAVKKWKFPVPNIPAPVYVDHTFHLTKAKPGDVKKTLPVSPSLRKRGG